MGKSGLGIGARVRGGRGAVGDQGAEAGEAVLPALAAGSAELGQVRLAVVGVGVRLARGGAEEVEVDAVHGLRPVCGSGFELAMKRGTIRIRKILGT